MRSAVLRGGILIRTKRAQGDFGGVGGRPPNVQCDKDWVRAYVPVKLLNVWVTKIFYVWVRI